MGFTATQLAAASLAVSTVGAVVSGIQQFQQAKFSSAVAHQAAERDRQLAAANEEEFRRSQSRAMARRRALLGVSGVDPGSGSPLAVTADLASDTELNALRIRSGGEVRATRLEQNAALLSSSATNALTGGFGRAGSSLLQGAAVLKGFGSTPTPFPETIAV